MPINPMQRRARNSFLIGFLIALIIMAIVVAVLLVVFCFMFWCGNKNKVYNHEWLYKTYIAHRGYFNNEKGVVENTKMAFLKAVEKGYLIETDISLTKDEKIIVYHDNDFKRLFNVDKKICELTLDEIKQLSIFDSLDEEQKDVEIDNLIKNINFEVGGLALKRGIKEVIPEKKFINDKYDKSWKENKN